MASKPKSTNSGRCKNYACVFCCYIGRKDNVIVHCKSQHTFETTHSDFITKKVRIVKDLAGNWNGFCFGCYKFIKCKPKQLPHVRLASSNHNCHGIKKQGAYKFVLKPHNIITHIYDHTFSQSHQSCQTSHQPNTKSTIMSTVSTMSTMSFNIADLHELYQTVSQSEAIKIANLGAICYQSFKAELLVQWESLASQEDTVRAEQLRSEGRESMMETLKEKLLVTANLQQEIEKHQQESVSLQQTLETLQASHQQESVSLQQEIAKLQTVIENETAKLQKIREEDRQQAEEVFKTEKDALRKQLESEMRMKMAVVMEENATLKLLEAAKLKKQQALEEELRNHSEDFAKRLDDAKEYQRLSVQQQFLTEISELRQKLASYESQSKLLVSKESECRLLQERADKQTAEYKQLEQEMKKIQEQQREKATKSSYAIGKQGEATVKGILNDFVLPYFLYSRIQDVAMKGHSADIHLYLQSPVGKQLKILVEAKQYTDAVKSKEITKLHSDVDGDDEASSGIMISTNSQISSVKQFQIEKTAKGKYILYLSVEGFDDEMRGKTICWAVRVLSTLAAYSKETGSNIVEKLGDFFKDLDKSVQEADTVLKNCQKALDSATSMKRTLAKRIEDFKVDNMIEAVPVNPTQDTITVDTTQEQVTMTVPEPLVKSKAKPRQKASKKTVKEDRIVLMNDEVFAIQGTNVYKYNEDTRTVGNYRGQLNEKGTGILVGLPEVLN